MKCHACNEAPAAYDGLCEGCAYDIFIGSDDATMVAEKLVGVINRQHERIADLESQLSEAQLLVEVRLAAIRRLDAIAAARRTNEQAQADKIIELEAQLAAALATIERAL